MSSWRRILRLRSQFFKRLKQVRSFTYDYRKPLTVLPVFFASNIRICQIYKARLEAHTDITEPDDDDHFSDHFLMNDVKKKPAIKVLVIDGGGLRGCMSIQILKELEAEMRLISGNDQLKLGECFDLIFGTSTGGLIALGLGKLNWDCQKIDEFYDLVAEEVFEANAGFLRKMWTKAKTVTSAIGTNTSFSTAKLEKILKENFGDKYMVQQDDPNWKKEPFISVIASLANNYQLAYPVLHRNYDITDGEGFVEFSDESKFHLPGGTYIKVWQAARATSAAPTYFEPVQVKMPPKMKELTIRRHIGYLVGVAYQHLRRNDQQKIDKIAEEICKLQNNESISEKEKNEQIDVWVGNIGKYNEDHGNEKISKKKFMKYVYDFEYILKFSDGGLNSNAPCLFAYTEASRLWPNCDIKMLSVGTGQTPPDQAYFNNSSPIFLAEIFSAVFGAKELVTLLPLISLGYINELDIERLNPNLEPSDSEMSNTKLMPKWRDIGKQYADTKKASIKNWARFLVQEQKNRDKVVQKYYDQQKEWKKKPN